MRKLKADDQSAVGVSRGVVASDLVSRRIEVASPRLERQVLEDCLHCPRSRCSRDNRYYCHVQ